MAGHTIRFSADDLILFSAASGDRNPLHLSAAYAAKTPYGQQVVFGALGAMACLGQLGLAGGDRIERITADFFRPMFLDVEYELRVNEQDGIRTGRLYDGSILVMALAVTLRGTGGKPEVRREREPHFELTQGRTWDTRDLVPGLAISGSYECDPAALDALRSRWGAGADTIAADCLLWSSYLVGMELPGISALFFRLVLNLEEDVALSGPLDYRATVRTLDTRLDLLVADVALRSGARAVASGEYKAFVRRSVSGASADELESFLAPSNHLEGKVVLVLGASRGLGAATARLLATQGAHVVAAARSGGAAVKEALSCPATASGRIDIEAGDSGDTGWLALLRQRIQDRCGRLDALVCNAFPALSPLRLEENALQRIQGYLDGAIGLVLVPLCSFLSMLNESSGCFVLISSSAVDEPPKEWPHYVAAKNAAEALARVAVLQYPHVSSLIVRPPKLLTDMTNTPMGRMNALLPEQMGARIVTGLLHPPPAGKTEILR